MPTIVKFIETECRIVTLRGRGEEGENWKLASDGHRISVWDDEKVQEMDSGW